MIGRIKHWLSVEFICILVDGSTYHSKIWGLLELPGGEQSHFVSMSRYQLSSFCFVFVVCYLQIVKFLHNKTTAVPFLAIRFCFDSKG